MAWRGGELTIHAANNAPHCLQVLLRSSGVSRNSENYYKMKSCVAHNYGQWAKSEQDRDGGVYREERSDRETGRRRGVGNGGEGGRNAASVSPSPTLPPPWTNRTGINLDDETAETATLPAGKGQCDAVPRPTQGGKG